MTTRGNEVLQYCLSDPFADFTEKYDGSLFEFQKNEVNLDVGREGFDLLNYDDIVTLKKNDVTIKGIVTMKERDAITGRGTIRIYDGNILAQRAIPATTIYNADAYSILKQLNNAGGRIFQSIDAVFGEVALNSYSLRKIINDLEVQLGPPLQLGYLMFENKAQYGIYILHGPVIYYCRNYLGEVVTSYELQPSYDGWIEVSAPPVESSEYIRNYYKNKLTDMLGIEYQYVKDMQFVWVKNQNIAFAFVLKQKNDKDYLTVWCIIDYNAVGLAGLNLSAAQQVFSNIISDICFMYDCYFYVENFSKLVIRPHGTAITGVDITNSREWIKEAKQVLEEGAFENYSLRTTPITGDNAWGLSDTEIAHLNNHYRLNYVYILKTIIKAVRVNINSNPFASLKLYNQVYDSGLDLGSVRSIAYLNEGRVAEFVLYRYLSTNQFNDWWRL